MDELPQGTAGGGGRGSEGEEGGDHLGPARANKTGRRAVQLLSLIAQCLGPGHAQRGKKVKGRKEKKTGPEQDASGSWDKRLYYCKQGRAI